MRKKIIITSTVLALLSWTWIWGIPSAFSIALPSIKSSIKKTFGYTLNYDQIKLKTSFSPYIRINSKNLTITNPNGIKIITTDTLNTKLSLLSLFLGKIQIANANCQNINATLYLDEPILKNQNAISLFKKLTFTAKEICVNTYNLELSPEQKSSGIKILGDKLYLSNKKGERILICDSLIKNNDKTSSINLNLSIPQNLNNKKLLTNIQIKNLDLGDIYEKFKKHFPNDITSVRGALNISVQDGELNSTLNNIQILYKEAFKSILLPQTLSCKGRLGLAENSGYLQATLNGEGINLNINTTGKKLFTKHPIYTIATGVDNTKSDAIIKMLPALHSEGVNLYYLKQTPLFSNVNGHILIKSNKHKPEISGDVLVNNAYMLNPLLTNKRQTDARISLKNDKVFYNVKVGIGEKEFVLIDGNSELYNDKNSKITIKSSPRVDLSVVQPIVSSLEKILYFNAGPVSIMNIAGYGNADFKIDGNLTNPHAWGNINFINATASFKEIQGIEISKANGFVKFDNQNVSFEFLDGKLDNNPVIIKGNSSLFGDLKLELNAEQLNLEKFYKAINTSPLLKELKAMLPPLDNLQGKANLKLSLNGNVPNINKVELNKNLFANGTLILQETSVALQDYQITNINGNIEYSPTDIKLDLKSKMKSSIINITGDIHNNIADLKINSPKLMFKDILSKSSLREIADNNFITFESNYKGKLNAFEFNKLNLSAKILPSTIPSPVNFSGGIIKVKNGICLIEDIKGLVTENPFVMNAKIHNLGEKNQNINANINLKNASLSTINLIREFYLIPKETKQLLRELDFQTGKTDINLKVTNNKPYSTIILNDVLIKYLPLDMPIKIINGKLVLNNETVKFSKINTLADNMPIFIDGQISNIYEKPYHNIYINSVPKQSFIDKYINKHTLYPLKIRGDVIYSAKVDGVQDFYNIAATAKLGEKASLYYLGATIGDSENSTIIDFNGDIVKNNSIKINNFEYNKVVSSQNNKQNIVNFLKMKGAIKLVNNEPVFQKLIVKTENPTDARIFNVLFKKPNIKQGLFTSDLSINGKLSDLKILGNFNIYEIDLPLLQTVLKSVALKFTNTQIDIDSRGEVFSNDIKFTATANNNLKSPFVIKNGTIHFDTLDLNAVISDLKKIEINKPKQNTTDKNQDFDITSLIIENLDLVADNILIKGIVAKDLKSTIALSKKMVMSLSGYSMGLANGTLTGDFNYNLLSKKADLLLNAHGIDANKLSIMLFDLSNQIYGDLTGTVNLACNATNDTTCTSTLYGDVSFNVKDGRMPKLGSLEYLLKAGNLIKGGFTGLSINSLIDLITPLKTGEFSDIYGTIAIKEGIADDIKITTKGKELNLYMKGDLNIATSDARMFVFGILSRQIKTPLGAVGNLSLNTLFNLIPGVDLESESPFISDINKIPGIELSQKAYRKFMAEIRGDISGENYVKSFKWIN